MRFCIPFLALSLALVGCGGAETSIVEGKGASNNLPVAIAGSNIEITADQPVNLDGSGSYDPDGDPITFHWTFDSVPTGSAVVSDGLPGNNTSTATTTFLADVVGTYVATLQVKDNIGNVSALSSVVITVKPGAVPVAAAGLDQTAASGATISLDGSGSYDPLGRALSYTWTLESLPSGSTSTLTTPTTVAPTFVADKGGLYVVSLVVNNGINASSPDTAVVRVSSADATAPVANAGTDIGGQDCTAIQLDGSGSFDANGDALTYQWDVQSVPSGSQASNASFSSRTLSNPTFYPDVAGSYTVSLTVHDGTSWATPDLMVISASERTYNAAPTVDAGAPKTAEGGEAECTLSGYTYDCEVCGPVTLDLGDDATVSDPDGDPLTYSWTVVSGEAQVTAPDALGTKVTLSDAIPTEPAVCDANEYVLKLTVTDCTGAAVSDTVTYTVNCCGIEAAAAR